MSSDFKFKTPIAFDVFIKAMVDNNITVTAVKKCPPYRSSFTVNVGKHYVYCFLDKEDKNVDELTRYGINNADFLIEVLRKEFNLDIDDDAL